MSEKRSRKLAAVMFTDIAGYTRLMQESEAQASQIRDRHRQVFDSYHGQFNGEILQYYGDGTLSIFESCLDAVECAIQMQRELVKAPSVPLRIGIHLGDIVISNDDIYGDGVNIASRVESLGVPGAVLISDEIQKQIHNHNISTVSMGPFQMKNVAKPLEIFAVEAPGIVVPSPADLEGKGHAMGRKSSRPRNKWIWRRSVFLIVLLVVLGLSGYWTLMHDETRPSELLPDNIREEKVAVAIFENFTNDPQLDALGFLASEWITSSLREIGIKTVAPEMIRQYQEYIGILPGNPEGKASFAEITQAKYLISGSYFALGDSLRMNTRLLDAITGDEIETFPVFWRKKDQKESLVEEARQRLMTHWAIEQNQHFPDVSPPTYSAYEKFLECTPGGYLCLIEVLALDSTFILPHTLQMHNATWGNMDSTFEYHKSYIERHLDICTQYEINLYRSGLAFWEGDYEQSFEFNDLNYQYDTMNVHMLHQTAYMATVYLNQPEITIDRYERLFEEYERFRTYLFDNIYYHYLDALNRNNEPEKVIQFVRQLPGDDWKTKTSGWSWFELYQAYLKTGRLENAIALVDTIVQWEPQVGHLSKAADIWSTFHQDTLANPFHLQIGDRISEFKSIESATADDLWSFYNGGAPLWMREYQWYLLQNWTEAEAQILQLKRNAPASMLSEQGVFAEANRGFFILWIESMLGNIYARQGRNELAVRQLDILQDMKLTFPEKHTPTLRGIIPYYQARIHALLGNKDEAVKFLHKSRNKGKAMFTSSFNMDYDLSSLRGYQPYEDLIRAKKAGR